MNSKDKYNGENLALMFWADGAYAVIIEEGTGDNLWSEDIDNGYVDYINWTLYAVRMDYDTPMLVEWDGGMVLTKEYVQNMTVEEVCNLVRNEVGCDANIPLIVYSSEELTL